MYYNIEAKMDNMNIDDIDLTMRFRHQLYNINRLLTMRMSQPARERLLQTKKLILLSEVYNYADLELNKLPKELEDIIITYANPHEE
jgi:hypothetical protein